MRRIETAFYTRITKAAARRRYETGRTVYFCPVNLNPDSPWGLMWYPPNNELPFEQLCKEYTWYNCDTERGRYPAFYITHWEE